MSDNADNATPKKEQKHPGGRHEVYTPEQIIAALYQAKGMVTLAAKALKCDYRTIVRYMNKYPKVQDAQIVAKERRLDNVEISLYNQAIAGDVTACIFILKTQGRSRGYHERLDVTQTVTPLSWEQLMKLQSGDYGKNQDPFA